MDESRNTTNLWNGQSLTTTATAVDPLGHPLLTQTTVPVYGTTRASTKTGPLVVTLLTSKAALERFVDNLGLDVMWTTYTGRRHLAGNYFVMTWRNGEDQQDAAADHARFLEAIDHGHENIYKVKATRLYDDDLSLVEEPIVWYTTARHASEARRAFTTAYLEELEGRNG